MPRTGRGRATTTSSESSSHPECAEILPAPSEQAQWSPDGCALEAELRKRRRQFSAIFRGLALAVLGDRDGGLHHSLYRAGLTRLDLDAEFEGAGAAALGPAGGAHH